jgi:hypothetical protein
LERDNRVEETFALEEPLRRRASIELRPMRDGYIAHGLEARATGMPTRPPSPREEVMALSLRLNNPVAGG